LYKKTYSSIRKKTNYLEGTSLDELAIYEAVNQVDGSTAAVCLLLPLIYTARRAPTAHLNGNCVRLLSEDKTEKMGETGETIRMQLSAMLIQTLETFHSSPLCERKNCRTVRDCEGICI
jgi:hypothetical protein